MKSKYILGSVIAVLLVIFGILLWNSSDNGISGKTESKEASIPSQDIENSNTVYYNGQEYEYNKDLVNILFMGIDTQDPLVEQETAGTAGQADCIFIISLDQKAESAKLLQISRDTMTDVDIYDVTGNHYATMNIQLATQYAYSNGGKSGNWAMKKTISRFLYDLPIDGTVAMNMEGIRVMNDAVGGVTLTIPEDYTMIDPAFVQGAVVTLNGEQAERYVRYRDTNITGSNNGRMKRQIQYLPALISAIRQKAGENGNYYETFSNILEPYMVLDMSLDDINEMAGYGFSTENIYTVPGEVRAGAEHDEFIVNENELHNLVINMFYKPVDNSGE